MELSALVIQTGIGFRYIPIEEVAFVDLQVFFHGARHSAASAYISETSYPPLWLHYKAEAWLVSCSLLKQERARHFHSWLQIGVATWLDWCKLCSLMC